MASLNSEHLVPAGVFFFELDLGCALETRCLCDEYLAEVNRLPPRLLLGRCWR